MRDSVRYQQTKLRRALNDAACVVPETSTARLAGRRQRRVGLFGEFQPPPLEQVGSDLEPVPLSESGELVAHGRQVFCGGVWSLTHHAKTPPSRTAKINISS